MAFASTTPPLTPAFLAGRALRPVPPELLQPVLTLAMVAMRRRHPDVFRRLHGLGDAAFLIEPTDLPLKFVLRPGGPAPSLTVLGRRELPPAGAATVSAPLSTLIELLEGRVDGDALFFSRDLAVENEMEALLTLRNAIDGAGIDLLETALSVLGPLAPMGRRVARLGLDIYGALSRDLLALQAVLTAPMARRAERHEADLEELREQVSALARRSRPSRASLSRTREERVEE